MAGVTFCSNTSSSSNGFRLPPGGLGFVLNGTNLWERANGGILYLTSRTSLGLDIVIGPIPGSVAPIKGVRGREIKVERLYDHVTERVISRFFNSRFNEKNVAPSIRTCKIDHQ
jgi:hypothetical protein